MAQVYLLNSPILTDYGLWRFTGPLTPDQARTLLAAGFQSAVGHAGSARVLEAVLGLPVPVARIRARLAPGDQAVVFRLQERLPEGVVLDEAGLKAVKWDLGLLERLE